MLEHCCGVGADMPAVPDALRCNEFRSASHTPTPRRADRRGRCAESHGNHRVDLDQLTTPIQLHRVCASALASTSSPRTLERALPTEQMSIGGSPWGAKSRDVKRLVGCRAHLPRVVDDAQGLILGRARPFLLPFGQAWRHRCTEPHRDRREERMREHERDMTRRRITRGPLDRHLGFR